MRASIASNPGSRASPMPPSPIQIAAGVALFGAGGVAGTALSATGDQPAAQVAAGPAPVEVRTEVVRRTVRVVRHERAIDAHVKNLRRKIEPEPSRPRYVLTVHGVGYRFADD